MIILKQLNSFARSHVYTPLFYISSVPHKLSNEGQKAVWAQQIINLIKNPKLPTSFDQESILDQINSLRAPKETTNFLFQKKDNLYVNKEEVMKLMTDGIILNPYVYSQSKIRKAQQITKETTDAESLGYSEQDNIQMNHSFIFYPNYLGTTAMFRQLDKKYQKNFLHTGETGISKTISIIFFIHLNNFITKYAVQCSKDPQLQKQLNLLQKENLIRSQIYKYWYWSISLDDVNIIRPLSIEKLIVEQAVELDQKQKNSLLICGNFDRFTQLLMTFYQKPIQMRAIVDQINIVASLMRKWNYYYQSCQKEEWFQDKEVQKAPLQKQIEYFTRKKITYTKAQHLQILLENFISLGAIYGLNSSLSIQKDLMSQKNMIQDVWSQQKKLAFEFKEDLLPYRIPYEKWIETPEGRVDFWNIGWFEIWRRLKLENIDIQRVKSIKRKYFEIVNTKKTSSFFRFVWLRQHLSSQPILFADLISNQKNFDISLQIIIEKYPEFCLFSQKRSIYSLFVKTRKWTRYLIYLLHGLASNMIKITGLKNMKASFNLQEFSNISILKEIDIPMKLKQIYLKKDAQILPFYIEGGDKLTFYWTYQQFFQITTHAIYPDKERQFFMSNSQFLDELYKDDGVARGSLLQRSIIQSLTPNSTFSYNIQSKGVPAKREQIIINSMLTFIPINEELTINKNVDQRQHFKRNFKNILSKCKQNPDEYFAAKPQYFEDGVLKYAGTSEGIDFIIAKYDQDKKRYLMRTYDITVLENPSSKVKKFKENAFSQLCQLAEKGQISSQSIRFEHVILSLNKYPKIETYKSPTSDFTLKIFLSNAMELSIQNSTYTEAVQFFHRALIICGLVLDHKNQTNRAQKIDM